MIATRLAPMPRSARVLSNSSTWATSPGAPRARREVDPGVGSSETPAGRIGRMTAISFAGSPFLRRITWVVSSLNAALGGGGFKAGDRFARADMIDADDLLQEETVLGEDVANDLQDLALGQRLLGMKGQLLGIEAGCVDLVAEEKAVRGAVEGEERPRQVDPFDIGDQRPFQRGFAGSGVEGDDMREEVDEVFRVRRD